MPMQGGEKMGTVWARQREDLLRDCLVSPDVFIPMVDRLAEFVVPYQHVLETEAGQRNVHLYLQGLLSHLPGKNAEDIATFVNVERQVIQDFIGTVPGDHCPLVTVLYMQRLILHRFYRASIRKACIHMLSTGCGEKNDAKLAAVCNRTRQESSFFCVIIAYPGSTKRVCIL